MFFATIVQLPILILINKSKCLLTLVVAAACSFQLSLPSVTVWSDPTDPVYVIQCLMISVVYNTSVFLLHFLKRYNSKFITYDPIKIILTLVATTNGVVLVMNKPPSSA